MSDGLHDRHDQRTHDRPRSDHGAIDTIVVGGGLAGLVAATTAAGPGRRVVLLDAHPIGGRARVDDRNGHLFNRGPRALYVGGAARPTLESLGVDTSAGAAPAVSSAWGRRHGRLHLLPQGPASLLRTTLLGPAEKVRFARLLARFPKLDAPSLAGTSFGELLARQRLSTTGAELVRMVARIATYAAEPDGVDAGAVVGNVQLALGDGVRYLDGGFQAIVDALAATAWDAGVEIRSVAATAVHPGDATSTPSVDTADGRLHARSVVVATGTPAAAARLIGAPIVGVDTLTAPVTAACLELGLRRPPRHRVLFGVDEPLYLSTHCTAHRRGSLPSAMPSST